MDTIENANKPVPARQTAVWSCLARILLLLAGIQAARAGVSWVLYTLFHPGLHSATWNWIGIAAYAVVGILLLVIFRPSAQRLGISWQGMGRFERILTALFGLLWISLVLTSWLVSPELLLDNLESALLIPVFEELIFRGWAWKTLESALPGRQRGLWTWLITALLFSFWHLGYMDSYLLKALPANPRLALGNLLGMKLLLTLIYGLVIGFFRWRTGRVFGSIWMHGFINLFGR